jgi:hypothetical protein
MSKYSKFTDEILIKKINGLISQNSKLEIALLCETKMDNMGLDFTNRIHLENVCDELTLYQNELKNKEKEVKLKQLEMEKNKKQLEMEEDNHEDVKKNYTCISDLETLKRLFFNMYTEEDNMNFLNEINLQTYKFYYLKYKYDSDMNNKATFMASNLNKGFVKRFDDYKKYLFGVFRCYQKDTNYMYDGFLLYNAVESIEEVIGDNIDDFEYSVINLESFLEGIKKLGDDVLDEKYIH